MTFLEALKKEKRWHKRALIINLYHNQKRTKHKKWTQRMTALKLGISLGAVNESIKLSKKLIENPELENLSREEALKH